MNSKDKLDYNLVKQALAKASDVNQVNDLLLRTLPFSTLVKDTLAKADAANEVNELLLHALPFATDIWDDTGKPIYCNQKTLDLFGLSTQEEYIQRFDELSPPFQRCGTPSHEVIDKYLEIVKEDGYARFEYTHLSTSGERLPVEITWVRINRNGNFLFIAYFIDLRPFKESIQQLRESNDLNEALLSTSPFIINIWDNSLNLISSSNQAVDMFGVDSKEEYVKIFHELSPEYQPCGLLSSIKAVNLVKQAFAEGYVKFEWMHQTKNKMPLPTEITLSRFKQGDKDMVAAYTIDLRPVKAVMEVEAALKHELEMAEFVNLIFDHAPIGVCLYDENYQLMDCNMSVVNMFGFSDKHEFILAFKHILTLLSPEYQPCGIPSAKKFEKILEQFKIKGYAQYEWMYLTASGEALPTEVTATKIMRQNTFVSVGYIHDLREIRTAQEKEYESNMINQILLDSAPFVIALWSDGYMPSTVSNYAKELFGVDDPNEAATRLYDFSPPFQPCGTPTPKLAEYYANLARKDGYANFDWMHIDINGDPLPVNVVYKHFTLNGNDMLMSYTSDLRKIKAAEKKERETNRRTRLIFDVAPLIIQYWDKDLNCIDCNKTTLDFYGFETKAVYFAGLKDALPLYQPDSTLSWTKWNDFLRDIFESKFSETDFVKKDLYGNDAFFEVVGVCAKYNGEMVAITYSTDVTELKKAQKEQHRIEVAEESNIAKTRFLAKMSHEIRTPLTAVLGISEIQLQNSDLTPRVEEAFLKIHNSSNMLLNIINDILDLSKIEAGKMDLIQDEYEVSSMISKASHLHFSYLNNKNIEFTLHVDENLPAYLIGDTLRIEQILNNLLSNAFKYTNEGFVKLSFESQPCSHMSRYANADYILLKIFVQDTGMGMTPEQLASISSDYTRFHETVNRSIGGTGLGMSIVYMLLQLMDGTIELESKVGIGTNVTILIPQKVSGSETLGKASVFSLQQYDLTAGNITKHFKFTPEPMPYGRVLVVDDIDANLYVAQGLLAFYELKIETCHSGYEAIEKVKQGNVYDIIFMDHMMPGINGTKTMQKIRKLGYIEPIIVLTANALIGQAEKFISEGFDGFVSKPIQTKHLNAVLIKHIRDKQTPEVIQQAWAESLLRDGQKTSIDDFHNNADLRDTLRKDFVIGQSDVVSKIRKAIEDCDMEKAHIMVHTLKTLSQLIGELKLAIVAEGIEILIDSGGIPSKDEIAELDSMLSQVLVRIGEPKIMVTQTDYENIDIANILPQLDQLRPMLEFRKAECLEMIDDLRKIPEAAILVKQIEKFDFAAAVVSLDILKEIGEVLI